MQLGPLVTPLARRHVGKVAHEIATLDHLSGGRMVLGVGLGIDNDYAAFAEPAGLRWRASRLDSGLDALAALWTGRPVSQSGAVVLDRASVLPRPVQDPLPVWTAIRWPGGARGPIRRAARTQGVFPVLTDWRPPQHVVSPGDLHALVTAVREAAGGELAPGYVVAHGGGTSGAGAPDDIALVEGYRDAGMTYWLESFHPASHTVDEAYARIEAGPPRVA